MLYTIILYTHIFSAIISMGPLFAIFPLLNRMNDASSDQVSGYIQSIQGILRAIANGGHIVVPSGLLLIWFGSWSWKTSWVLLTIIVMFASLFFMARAFKPAMTYSKSDGFVKEKFISMIKTATWKYIFLMGILLWLMVVKPNFW
ncbi:hypothetical protein CSE16_01415 [Solibacillus sp. R5-41]|uniref:hypothetical protein n=1 Tax=Solibacillus sp. R5-41 TaxID=2048654 RepID=UPI000C12991C|nr:hypothetical protein [Solibacillus sp. R5-41]ATP38777.1 hypothetical protein CSE16_01415 [Solibacillus sp. R5-41]